ncbi:MAG TPA: FkbM family methyltransferase [Abditibacterium sp.]|jgi:FkbM family methyltransferase
MPRLQSVTLADGRKIWCSRRDEVRGVREQADGYWKHGIEVGAGSHVFDVGANIGLFSLEAAARGARVHAFEPMPATFAALAANARDAKNGTITPHRLALGAKAETARFAFFPYLSVLSTRFPDAPQSRSAEAISAVFDDPAMTPRAGWFRRAPAPLRRVFIAFWQKILFSPRMVECQVETLSHQIEKSGVACIDLLKIDVEGAEWDVLKGIEVRHWPLIHQIVAEVHDENGRLQEFKDLLQKRGFADLHVEKEPGAGQWDVYLLWARRA